jgi:hypothetical protein
MLTGSYTKISPQIQVRAIPYRVNYYWDVKLKFTLPVLAPPIHVLVNSPVGQVALAARIQPSQRPLETLIVAPATVVESLKRAVPELPVVEVGLPLHFVMAPAMPPQI